MVQPQDGNKWDGKRPDPITTVKEGWYDKLLRRVPLTVKALDILIAVLFLLFIAALVIGTLKGKGIL